jgi:serine/threonine-protein phosphatase 2A activator
MSSNPPSTAPQRFGNLAFRSFHSSLMSSLESLHQHLLAEIPESLVSILRPELFNHFSHCFGNETRIDYGTGHELEFLAYLTILSGNYEIGDGEMMKIWKRSKDGDELWECVVVFRKYIEVCRRLQKVYNLEPAGSKGVYGLDDHQQWVLVYIMIQSLFNCSSSIFSLSYLFGVRFYAISSGYH